MAEEPAIDYLGTGPEPVTVDGQGDTANGSDGAVNPASLGNFNGGSNSGDGGSSQPVKRGRGRPRKDGSAPGSPRASGSGSASKKTKDNPDLSFLQGFLVTGHEFAAYKTGIQELRISQAEAKALTDASSELAGYYGVAISGQTSAWMNFMSAIGQVYGTRAIAIIANSKAQAKEQRQPPSVNNGPVVDLYAHRAGIADA